MGRKRVTRKNDRRKQYDKGNKTRNYQGHVLRMIKYKIDQSSLKKNPELFELMETSQKRLYNMPVNTPFNRKSYIYDLMKITDGIDDTALKEKVFSLVRGIRNNLSDLQEERALAEINAELGKIRGINLETAFIFKDSAISSSTVKSLCQLGEFIAVQGYVSSFVHQKLMEVYLKPYLQHFITFEREESRGAFYAKLVEAYKDRAYHNLSHQDPHLPT